MSDLQEPSTNSKPKAGSAMLVDRKAFLETLRITSMVLQQMGSEFESLRTATWMDPRSREDLMALVKAHLNNVSAISASLQLSVYDPKDPMKIIGSEVN